jgi:hypothetical protein
MRPDLFAPDPPLPDLAPRSRAIDEILTIDAVICDAIHRRHLLAFDYDGAFRLVQPAALGLHRTTKKLSLRAYQVAGHSGSGRPAGWRLYTVRKIRNAHVREEPFVAPPPGYRPGDDDLAPIVCRL